MKVGLNLQKNQKLTVQCPADCAYFARKIVDAAYEAGASEVIMQWNDSYITRSAYLNAPDSFYETFPRWKKVMYEDFAEENVASLAIDSRDPEALKGVDFSRIMKASKLANENTKAYTDKAMADEVQWCVVSIPNDAWAKKVFPEAKTTEEATEKLWDAIYSASRVDENDTVQNWQIHQQMFKKRVDILNNYQFKSLKYKNSLGTDLEIELPENHIWMGGESSTKEGVKFMANIPTEEIFTAPLRTGVNGKVVSTKPYVCHGDIIEDFSLEFKNGKVVNVSAKNNQEKLEQFINSAPNADYLGEVALVPYNSPISESNILFYNTLYDENASCHLAFGRAYTNCVQATEGKTEEELNEMGVNQSLVHSDFMVGSADLSIKGITRDGKEIDVFIDGNFVF